MKDLVARRLFAFANACREFHRMQIFNPLILPAQKNIHGMHERKSSKIILGRSFILYLKRLMEVV